MNGTNIPFLFARLPLCCGKTRRPLPRKLVLSHPRKVYAQRRPQAHKRTSGHDRRWIQTPMTASPASPPRMNGRPAEPGVGSGHHPAVPPGYFPGIPRRPLQTPNSLHLLAPVDLRLDPRCPAIRATPACFVEKLRGGCSGNYAAQGWSERQDLNRDSAFSYFRKHSSQAGEH